MTTQYRAVVDAPGIPYPTRIESYVRVGSDDPEDAYSEVARVYGGPMKILRIEQRTVEFGEWRSSNTHTPSHGAVNFCVECSDASPPGQFVAWRDCRLRTTSSNSERSES